MNIVRKVDEHFKRFTNPVHVFRVKISNNVDKQRVCQIFQLYGYTLACMYQDLETLITEQLGLALDVVDISEFEIKVSKTVFKPKFVQSGILIFKTINIENFVGIEPINNGKISSF